VNILIVEDEARIADFLRRGLAAEGWSVSHAQDGEIALELLQAGGFDVMVLDVMLPGISGIDVCRWMRVRNDVTPVLMLTAMGDVDHRVEGLRAGADDYLPKPFDFDELVARLVALNRRSRRQADPSAAAESSVLRWGALVYDLGARRVEVAGRPVELTKREREVLLVFLRNPNRLISRERLLNSIWGVSEDPLTNVVDVHVARLRKKLGDVGAALRTLRGEGYILDCP
jgi:DNA-binding response OmpR family regulator